MRTRGNDGLFESISRDVIYGLSFFARIIDRGLHLNGRHFLLQVRRAFLAETTLIIPTVTVHPFATAFTFVEVRLGFLHRFSEGIIVRLLPTRRADSARYIRSSS